MKKPLYDQAFLLILLAIAAGALLGHFDAPHALQVKPLGELFIGAIRLLVGPLVFCTITAGLASMKNLREVGSVGFKTLLYFELLSALALLAGLAMAALLQPGAGFRLDGGEATQYAAGLAQATPAVPLSLAGTLAAALLHNAILQVMLTALLCGLLLPHAGRSGAFFLAGCQRVTGWLFVLIRLLLKAAPLAAFCAMAYAVGKHGLGSVGPLLKLLGAVYLASFLFVAVLLGAIAHLAGFSLWRFIVYIKEELALAFGTASSVTAMPGLMAKLRLAGCSEPVVGLVVPAGYSFNLSGSNLYLAMAMVFLAQASGVELGAGHYLAIFTVAMITTKGSSGVAGAAFLVLSATLAAVPQIPPASLLFVFSIERLLKCRPLVNLIGNGVACLAIAAWSVQLDREKLRSQLQRAQALDH